MKGGSRSLRARGLKSYKNLIDHLFEKSRSLRARGLKLKVNRYQNDDGEVALFTGAWIEMSDQFRA